jgi:hypothetical protein
MNVIKKFYDRLPKHWQKYIKEKGWFYLDQFDRSVSISYDDGSHMFFNCAFAVHDEARDELAVFTEHCGYHVFQASHLGWQSYVLTATGKK